MNLRSNATQILNIEFLPGNGFIWVNYCFRKSSQREVDQCQYPNTYWQRVNLDGQQKSKADNSLTILLNIIWSIPMKFLFVEMSYENKQLESILRNKEGTDTITLESPATHCFLHKQTNRTITFNQCILNSCAYRNRISFLFSQI